MIYDSILGTIGRTPVVRINRLAPAGTTMYVKCEFFNPLSSVKDRLAIAIIEDAERSGTLKPGQTVVEATSGNTGIALAMVCAAKGYPFVAVMVETFSIERRKIMRMLGAKVILTPAAERGPAMVAKAEELAKKHGWFLARQFENQANPAYHRNTTGPEILRTSSASGSIIFVTGWGTGGTLTGAGEMIKLARPDTKVIVCRARGRAVVGRQAVHAAQDPGLDAGFRARRCSIARWPIASCPSATPRPSRPRARWRRRKASSSASPAAPRSPRRCKVAREAGPGSRDAGDAARYRRTLPVDRACSKASPTAATPSRERIAAPAIRACIARGGCIGLAEVSLGPATKFAALPDPFPFWRGGTLREGRVAYESWGELNAARNNAILLFTGLSPSAHAASSPRRSRARAGGRRWSAPARPSTPTATSSSA